MLKRLLFAALMAFASLAQGAAYSLPWGPKPQWVDANGAPMSSGTLTFFAAGTTTLQNTYTTQAGSVANTNPVTLNSRGESPNEVWLGAGQTYKLVLKDSSGSTVWTVDNITGVNDPAATITEWVGGATPTYVSANSFTLPGDYTTLFTPGRRLKFTVTAGTVYGTIYTSAFATVTTVTMVMDSTGNLDSGLSAVSYGFLHSTNPSIPSVAQVTLASATTVNLASATGASLHISGVTTITSFGNAPSGLQRTAVFDGALTLTHNGTSLILPGAANITTAAGDVGVFVSEGSGNWRCISYVGRNGAVNNLTVSGGTISTGSATALSLQTSGGEQARITNTASANRYVTLTGSNGAEPSVGTSAGALSVGTGLQVTGSTGATSGAGVEVSYSGGVGILLSFNRTGAAYAELDLNGSLLVGKIAGGEAWRTTAAGYFKASNNATYQGIASAYHEFTTNTDGVTLQLTNTAASAAAVNGIDVFYQGVTPNSTTAIFFRGRDASAVRHELRSNGGIANFQANDVNLSDETVKTGLRIAGSYWGFIKDLRVVDGWYTDDLQANGAAARRHTMLTAQNVQAVEKMHGLEGPRSVVTQFDEAGHLGVQEHSIEMRHLTVTQELQARVEHLEKRLAELEARMAANDAHYKVAAGR